MRSNRKKEEDCDRFVYIPRWSFGRDVVSKLVGLIQISFLLWASVNMWHFRAFAANQALWGIDFGLLLFGIVATVLSEVSWWNRGRQQVAVDRLNDDDDETKRSDVSTPSVAVILLCCGEDVALIEESVRCALVAVRNYVAKPNGDISSCVYVCDDGRSKALKRVITQQFNDDTVRYCARSVQSAGVCGKSGNMLFGLQQSTSDLVLFLDCDFRAVPAMLCILVDRLVIEQRDRTRAPIAYVQAPQAFHNACYGRRWSWYRATTGAFWEFVAAPLQRGALGGNSVWFGGTNALFTRDALSKIKCIATPCVTEDRLITMQLRELGYRSVSVSMPVAWGIAPDTPIAFEIQRRRWLRGGTHLMLLDRCRWWIKDPAAMTNFFTFCVSPAASTALIVRTLLLMTLALLADDQADEAYQQHYSDNNYPIGLYTFCTAILFHNAAIFPRHLLATVVKLDVWSGEIVFGEWGQSWRLVFAPSFFLALLQGVWDAFRWAPSSSNNTIKSFEPTPKGSQASKMANNVRVVAMMIGWTCFYLVLFCGVLPRAISGNCSAITALVDGATFLLISFPWLWACRPPSFGAAALPADSAIANADAIQRWQHNSRGLPYASVLPFAFYIFFRHSVRWIVTVHLQCPIPPSYALD
jgi:Glycosyl transferase family group 2